MLIICGTITRRKEKVLEFFKDISGVAARTESEHGCIDFGVALQDETRGEILLIEKWRDQKSLDVHLQLDSVHNVFKKWGAEVKMSVEKYDASNEREPM